MNLAARLEAMARARPEAKAVIFVRGRTSWTFRELEARSAGLAHGLAGVGIGRGTRTVLLVPPGPDFFALAFALLKIGAVVVVVDPGLGRKNLGRCLEEAEPEAFVGVARAALARGLLGWARGTLRVRVTAGPVPVLGGPTVGALGRRGAGRGPYPAAPVRPDETAAIVFTSGSTGPPRGVVYTHGVLAAQVAGLRRLYGIEPGEVDLPTFALFALFDPVLGLTAVIPPMDFTRPGRAGPGAILEAIRRHRVTSAFGSPALLDRVGRYGVKHGIRLPTLRRVISAGAPVPAPVLERFTRLLAPGVQVFTPYGATEAMPVTSIGSAEVLGETAARTAEGAGVCVGRPVDGIALRILRITEGPIACWRRDLEAPAGEIGEIAVQGPVVTPAYFNDPGATRRAKIPDPASGGFFHRMGDLGYRDERGRLWYCGRKSQRVRTAGATLFTVPCEGVFNAHPDVRRTALVGVGPPRAARPVLCVELERPGRRADRRRIASELLAAGAARRPTRSIRTVLFRRTFPVDVRHNAKIGREKLAGWAAGRIA